jgi:SAM-dependent methyltransferase
VAAQLLVSALVLGQREAQVTSSGFSGNFDLRDANFESLYQGGPILDGLHFPSIPWDIAEAQPAVRELEQAGRFRGDVLDVGCGLGENSIFLAGCGYRVTGVDIAPTALDEARRRAAERGVEVDFSVSDATMLAGYDDRFDSVLDSACYHCLDEDARRRYAAALHRATRPGALLNLLCFADVGSGFLAAMNNTEESLRDVVGGAGWTITDLRRVNFVVNPDLDKLISELGLEMDLTPDGNGRLQVSVWSLQAERAEATTPPGG